MTQGVTRQFEGGTQGLEKSNVVCSTSPTTVSNRRFNVCYFKNKIKKVNANKKKEKG